MLKILRNFAVIKKIHFTIYVCTKHGAVIVELTVP